MTPARRNGELRTAIIVIDIAAAAAALAVLGVVGGTIGSAGLPQFLSAPWFVPFFLVLFFFFG